MGFAAVSAYEGCCHEVRDGFDPIVLTKKQRNALITDVVLAILVGVTVFLAVLAARGVDLSAFNALSKLPVLGRLILGTIACGLVVFDFLLLMIITCAHVSKLYVLKDKMQIELTNNAATKLHDSQEISKLRKDLSDAQKKVSTSEVSTEDHEALKQELAKTQQERDSYQKNLEIAKKEITDEEKRKLFEDNGTLQQEIRFAKNAEEVLNGRISKLEPELLELRSKQALAQKMEELQQQVNLLITQKSGLDTEISGKSQQLSSLEQDIASRTIEFKNLQETQRQTKESLENEIADLTTKKTQIDREKRDLEESRNHLQEDIGVDQKTLERLKKEKAQLEAEIKKLDEVEEALSKKIETIKASATPEAVPKAEKTVEVKVKEEKTEALKVSDVQAPKVEETKLESPPEFKETKHEATKSDSAEVSKEEIKEVEKTESATINEMVDKLLTRKFGQIEYRIDKFAILKLEDSKREPFLKGIEKDVKYFVEHVVSITKLSDDLKANKSENQAADLETLKTKCAELTTYIDQIAKIEGVELSTLFA